jgi:tRNA (cytidine/uridine-2'-O-)-methyltransferase
VTRHANWQAFLESAQPSANRLFALTTRASHSVFDVQFQTGDYLVFGSETKGISDTVRAAFGPGQSLKLPMQAGQRSLNLSNAVAVTVFEAWRQNGFGAVDQA